MQSKEGQLTRQGGREVAGDDEGLDGGSCGGDEPGNQRGTQDPDGKGSREGESSGHRYRILTAGSLKSPPTMEKNEGGAMALVKTIGVLLLIGLALWIISVVVGFIASTVVTIFEFLIIAAVVGAVYHYFKHQKAHRT